MTRLGRLLVAGSTLIALGCEPKVETGRNEEEKTPAAAPAAPVKPAAKPAPAPAPAAKPATPAAEPKKAEAPPAPPRNPALLDPSLAKETAPEVFKVKVSTTKGDFTIEVTRSWSPQGADRFYNLVKIGFFDDVSFFRVIEGFMAQFGINGDPRVSAKWRSANIPDDEVVQSNMRGYVTFAKTGLPNSRSTQLFINFDDNANLDGSGFSPIGRVTEGMDVVDSLYKGYGEGAPRGRGPDQGMVQSQGNAYLRQSFPELDSIKTATIVP